MALVVLLGAATSIGAAARVGASATSATSMAVRVSTPVPVTAVNLSSQLARNSPGLAVDPTDSRFVVVASRVDGPDDFGCEMEVSGDSGRSWLQIDPVPTLPAGAEHCYGPEVAFDRKGRLFYLFVGLHGEGNVPMGAFLTSSNDRGRTFAPPRQVLGPDSFGVRMAIDPTWGSRGRLHLAWMATDGDPPIGGFPASGAPIFTAHSDDGGVTFSTPLRLSDPKTPLVAAPALVLGPDHEVAVAFFDLKSDARDYEGLEGPTWDGTWALRSQASADAGRTFRPGTVADGIVASERVMLVLTMPPASLAADRTGRLYAAWSDARGGDADVLVATSPGAGRSWGQPVRVNDDAPGKGRTQYLPRLSIAPNGRVDAVFYDRRDDPENIRNDVWFASSLDHGRSFSANTKLTTESFYADTGVRYPIPSARGLVEFGSRLALVSDNHGALAAWTDTHLSRRHNEEQDVYAASVSLAVRARRSGAGAALAGVVVLAAVGVVGVAFTRARRGRRRRAPVSHP